MVASKKEKAQGKKKHKKLITTYCIRNRIDNNMMTIERRRALYVLLLTITCNYVILVPVLVVASTSATSGQRDRLRTASTAANKKSLLLFPPQPQHATYKTCSMSHPVERFHAHCYYPKKRAARAAIMKTMTLVCNLKTMKLLKLHRPTT
jgi:hypothetical protein